MQLPAPIRNLPWRRYSYDQLGSGLLLAASLIVGVAIASPDSIARAINGVSGVLWIAGAGLLLAAVRSDGRFWLRLLIVITLAMVLVLFLRPSDLGFAIAGFGGAGALIALMFGDRGVVWARVLTALWLPAHLLTAVGKAIYRALTDSPASIRSDPPPTAALVPFAMMVAAWAGAWIVIRVIRKESGSRRV